MRKEAAVPKLSCRGQCHALLLEHIQRASQPAGWEERNPGVNLRRTGEKCNTGQFLLSHGKISTSNQSPGMNKMGTLEQ
jgi:hypothetical protein